MFALQIYVVQWLDTTHGKRDGPGSIPGEANFG